MDTLATNRSSLQHYVQLPVNSKRFTLLKTVHARRNAMRLEQLFSEKDYPNLFAVTKRYSYLLPSVLLSALSLQDYFKDGELPLLQAGESAYVELTTDEVVSLVANAFLCTFDFESRSIAEQLSNSRRMQSYSKFNCAEMFAGSDSASKQSMIECLLRYFQTQTSTDKTKIVYERRVLNEQVDWFNSDKLIANVCLQVDKKKKIEQIPDAWQAVFANRFIGGGALTGGNCQEEIRFNVSPELLVSMLLCEAMQDNEAIVVYGSRQFSDYTGYGSAFRGKDWSPSKQKLQASTVFAIDALDLRNDIDPLSTQYKKENLVRELNKFYCAVKPHDAQVTTKRKRPIAGDYSECEGWQAAVNNSQLPPVATGYWGCGAFCGDPELKVLLQIMAAAQAGRQLTFSTFESDELVSELKTVYESLKTLTVGQCFKVILTYDSFVRKRRPLTLFAYLLERFSSQRAQTVSSNSQVAPKPSEKLQPPAKQPVIVKLEVAGSSNTLIQQKQKLWEPTMTK